MSYLLDKNKKIQQYKKVGVVIVLVLFLVYFRAGIFRGLSVATHTIVKPIIVFGHAVGDEVGALGTAFRFKQSLLAENENLKNQILESQADRANYASVVDENTQMKAILGNKPANMNLVLSGILLKPNQSLYDTVVIDKGSADGIQTGDRVFASGNIPIGNIAEVYGNSANVVLFSNPGEKTNVIVSGSTISLSAIGRGGGNFELDLPKDSPIAVGNEVDLPGTTPYILGTVATIVSDPRDSFQKAILISPVNVQQLKFVEVSI